MRASVLLFFFAMALAPTVVNAAPSSEDRAAAQGLFDDARALVKNGRAAEACSKFEGSQQLDPAVGTQLYLADCYEKSGRTASAWAAFLDAADAASKAGDTKRANVAKENVKRLEPQLARVRVSLATDVDGVVVTRDGKPLARVTLASELPTDPGKRVFEASAPGYKNVRLEVDVVPGARKDVLIPALEKVSVAPPPFASSAAPPTAAPATATSTSTPRDAPRSGGLSTWQVGGIVAGGVGVVAIVGGLLIDSSARNKNESARASGCRPDGTFCTPDALSQHDSAKSQASLGTIGVIAGGVFLAGGITLFLLSPSSGRESASLVISPTVSPTASGLLASGRFW